MIVVTGGAGFIGSAIVAALNARGRSDVLIVDILGGDEKWKNLRTLSFADYIDAEDFSGMLARDRTDWDIEAVFHMGACSDTTETDAGFLVRNNYEYSKMVAQWALGQNARFIYASSAATYGDGSAGFDDDLNAIENLRPLNMYGYSKQMFDLWAQKNGLLDRAVGLKFFNVFGPNEYHKANMRSFVLKAFEQICRCGRVQLFKSHRPDYADGGQLRDFLYIKDAVEMTLFFLDCPAIGGIFNIGTGKSRTWIDLANAVFAAMNKEPVIEFVPIPENIREKYQYYTQAEIAGLRDAGYVKPVTPLEKAVADYVRNYLIKGQYLG